MVERLNENLKDLKSKANPVNTIDQEIKNINEFKKKVFYPK